MRQRFMPNDVVYHILSDGTIGCSAVDFIHIKPLKITCTILTKRGDGWKPIAVDQEDLFKTRQLAEREVQRRQEGEEHG